MLSLIDAARPRRNGQPKARQKWPCDAVAAFSAMGSPQRRSDDGKAAPKGESSRLDPRAVFPRETALTPKSWGPSCRSILPTWESLTLSRSPPPIPARSGSGSTEFGKTCSIGSTCQHCTRFFSTTSGLSKPVAWAGGSSSAKPPAQRVGGCFSSCGSTWPRRRWSWSIR